MILCDILLISDNIPDWLESTEPLSICHLVFYEQLLFCGICGLPAAVFQRSKRHYCLQARQDNALGGTKVKHQIRLRYMAIEKDLMSSIYICINYYPFSHFVLFTYHFPGQFSSLLKF